MVIVFLVTLVEHKIGSYHNFIFEIGKTVSCPKRVSNSKISFSHSIVNYNYANETITLVRWWLGLSTFDHKRGNCCCHCHIFFFFFCYSHFPFDPNHSPPQKWKRWFVLIRFISLLLFDNFDLFVSSNPNWNCHQVDLWGWWGVCKLVRVEKSQNIYRIHFVLWMDMSQLWWLFTYVSFFSLSWALTNKMNCLRWLDEYIQ